MASRPVKSPGALHFAELGGRLQERKQQRLDHRPRADHPGGDAVDAGVEVVEADVRAAQVVAAHQFLRDRFAARR